MALTTINRPDNEKILLGTGSDVEIYHDGTHTRFHNKTGFVTFRSNGFQINDETNNETCFKTVNNGATELYYDNVKKFQTTSGAGEFFGNLVLTPGHIYLQDNYKVQFGGAQDLQIYHDGTDSKLVNATGYLRQDSASGVLFANADETENIAKFFTNGAAELYYDNSKKFETESTGVAISGSLSLADGDGTGGSNKISLGTHDDLNIFHNGSHSYIKDSGTGNLVIQTNMLGIQAANGLEDVAKFTQDGAVELFYDNFKSFATSSNGIILQGPEGGDAQIDLNADEGDDNPDKWRIVAGQGGVFQIKNYSPGSWDVLLDATVDAGVGLYHNNAIKINTNAAGVTVSGNVDISDGHLEVRDAYKARFGASQDLEIYHSGSHSFMQNNTGTLYFKSNTLSWNSYDGENIIWATKDAEVRLFYDNVKKFETQSIGVTVTGQVKCDELNLADSSGSGNNRIKCGTGDDLQMWHNGSHSYIANTTGGIHISTNNGDAWIQSDANVYLGDVNGNEAFVKCIDDGAVQLYHNNTVKFSTTSWGVQPGGDVVPNGDNSYDLGSSIERWDNVYATNGTIQTSDRNEKNTIVSSDLGLSFVNKLKPVSYKFNNKTRTHYGLIAQDVETTLSDISKSTANFAGFIKTDNSATLYADWDELPDGKNIGDVRIAAKTTYGLRYNEFIAPLIKAVQELSAEVETLKTKVAALEAG